MSDIDDRIQMKLAEIRDNHANQARYSMEQSQFDSPASPSVKDISLHDRYSIEGELLKLELHLLYNEENPNLFPLDSDRNTIMAKIKEKQYKIEKIDDEVRALP